MNSPKVMGIDPLTGLPPLPRCDDAAARLAASVAALIRAIERKEERERELRALRAQRDELLAVAREAAEHYARLCGDDTSYTPLASRLERASAAIARATGAQEASR